MTSAELRSHLSQLGMSQGEAASLLGVNPRTLRRWLEGEELSGPPEHALRAWLALHKRGMGWRPDSTFIDNDDVEQIARFRQHAIDLHEMLERVRQRGGPIAPWKVEVSKCKATLGQMEVSFYKLPNGGFSPQSYRRNDVPADPVRDQPFLEDAYACIAAALSMPEMHDLVFLVQPGTSTGFVHLLDVGHKPWIAAKIPCDAIRNVVAQGRDITDDECRQLFVASQMNRHLVGGAAQGVYSNGDYSINDSGVAVLTLGGRELAPLAAHFDLTAANRRMVWGIGHREKQHI